MNTFYIVQCVCSNAYKLINWLLYVYFWIKIKHKTLHEISTNIAHNIEISFSNDSLLFNEIKQKKCEFELMRVVDFPFINMLSNYFKIYYCYWLNWIWCLKKSNVWVFVVLILHNRKNSPISSKNSKKNSHVSI